MKLIVLVDNNTATDEHFLAEPGLSYWIEKDNKYILFDTGFSDIYIENAKKLNVDLAKTDYIVLSHGHNDHTTGLKFFPHPSKRITLITHPDCLLPKYITDDYYIGSPVSLEEAGDKFNYVQSKESYFIAPDIVFLGEIKEKYGFEKKNPTGYIIKNNQREPDLLLDDSAISIRTKKGIVIVTGCSHSGICNIISATKEAFKNEKIYSVIGGFHLRNESEDKLQKIVEVFKEEVVGPIYPAHCTDLKAKSFLGKYLDVKEVFVSQEIKFD